MRIRFERLDGCLFLIINRRWLCKHDLKGPWEHMSAQLRKGEQ